MEKQQRTRAEISELIADHAKELSALAHGAGMATLAYVLDMAELEARNAAALPGGVRQAA